MFWIYLFLRLYQPLLKMINMKGIKAHASTVYIQRTYMLGGGLNWIFRFTS
jgi:hypothetical protein